MRYDANDFLLYCVLLSGDEFVFLCNVPGVWGHYTDGRVVFNNGPFAFRV